jgi:hypothetical protein
MRLDATTFRRVSKQDVAAGEREKRRAANKTGGDDGVVRR